MPSIILAEERVSDQIEEGTRSRAIPSSANILHRKDNKAKDPCCESKSSGQKLDYLGGTLEAKLATHLKLIKSELPPRLQSYPDVPITQAHSSDQSDQVN